MTMGVVAIYVAAAAVAGTVYSAYESREARKDQEEANKIAKEDADNKRQAAKRKEFRQARIKSAQMQAEAEARGAGGSSGSGSGQTSLNTALGQNIAQITRDQNTSNNIFAAQQKVMAHQARAGYGQATANIAMAAMPYVTK